MCAIVWTWNAGGQTLRTDKVRTTFQLNTNSTTELVHLVTSSTDLHLGTVALAFVPGTNTLQSYITFTPTMPTGFLSSVITFQFCGIFWFHLLL